MKRSLAFSALVAAMLLAGCGGASGTPASSSGSAPSSQPSAAAGVGQFGGDVCSALTKADIEGASYAQGTAVFDSTDTQKDPTGAAVVCQYLVRFGGNPSIVGVAVSLMDATEFATHAAASLVTPEEAVSGIGTEAYVVAPAPGLFEVWVHGAHGYFKVGAQTKATDVALATVAAGRD